MDKLDWDLLKVLSENPAGSYTEVKEKLNVSIGTIYMRVRRLQEDWGVVKGQRLILDPQKLGFSLVGLIRVQAADVINFVESIKAHPEVGVVWMTTGDMNVLIEAYFRNTAELQGFLSKLTKYGANRTEAQLILDKPVETGVPVIPPANLHERSASSRSRKGRDASSTAAKAKSKK